MNIYMIRHGQTAQNKAGLLHGRGSNAPLNEEGFSQAEAAAGWFLDRHICFDAVYSSPLERALQTARVLAPSAPLIVDERLIEMDYGPYEGLDLRHMPPEVLTFFRDFVHNPAPVGMELLSAVVERAGSFLEDLKKNRTDQTVLLSTHAIALKGLLEYLTPDSQGRWWSEYIGNCAVFRTLLCEGHYSVPLPLSIHK